MADARDVYADQFQVHLSPYGVTLNFFLTTPLPPSGPGPEPPSDRVATIRTSLEHAKVIAYLLYRQLVDYEVQSGVRVMVPGDVLNGLGIGPEDWDSFWKP
jgi:hypothetical protein